MIEAAVFAGSIVVFLAAIWALDEWKRYRADRAFFEGLIEKIEEKRGSSYVIGCKCPKCLEARTKYRSRWR